MDIKNMADKAEKVKEQASGVMGSVAANKDVKKAVNGVIGEVEKKTKMDLPDVDGIKKMLD